SVNRAKEVGVRKVVGSTRQSLIQQFLSEAALTCFLAVFLALGLAVFILPIFNRLAAREYVIGNLLNFQTGLMMLGLTAVLSFLAGLYPAISLSSFHPIEVLKGRFQTGKKGTRLRKGLVVLQFAISSVLIFGTLVVSSQLKFMMRQDLGFDANQVISLDTRRAPGEQRSQLNSIFKQALAGHSSVQEVSTMGGVPGRSGWRGQISFPEGWPEGKSLDLEYVPVDYDFVQTLGLKIIAGRNFDPSFTTDSKTAVMINESAVEAVGWLSPADAIGKGFASPGSGKPDGIVIGVVENYHHHGLQEKIESMMFGIKEVNSFFAIRIDTAGVAAAVKHVQKTWDQFYGGYPYELFFLDEDFARQYEQEQRLKHIFSTFTLLTILIACMGLFGLTAFTSSQRIKEIGVRKVLGASVPNIIKLLSIDFLKLVVVSLVIAAPVGYYLIQQWQRNFAYRSGIRIELFLFNAGILLLIAFATICFQSVKTALADPAQSLRHE
ncbi:FtsX-like permease family protein, partial [Acidobacteriota bacterium]